jgi:hypothetical protein
VAEDELALSGDRRSAGAPKELLALEREQQFLGLSPGDAADRLDGAQPEDLSDHGRVLQQLFLVLRERVQPGGDDSLDRLRQLREITSFEQRLARIDRDPDFQLVALLPSPVADRERCPYGPFGIVLVRGRCPEQRHHRVADEFLDGSTEALELGAKVSVVWREQRAHVLRVERLRPSREADQVGEEHGDHLPFLANGPIRRRHQRGAAVRAERELPFQLPATVRAGHRRSLGA